MHYKHAKRYFYPNTDSYMLLSGLYARHPQLRFDHTLLFAFASLPFALGHLFTVWMYIAGRNAQSQDESIAT